MDGNQMIERYRQERDEQYNRRVEVEEELARVKKEREELIAELDVKHDKLVRLSDKFRATAASIKRRDEALSTVRDEITTIFSDYKETAAGSALNPVIQFLNLALSHSEEEKEAH